MKIYIITDLEGVSGLDHIDLMSRDHPRHREAREWLMGDVNAAVDGAFAGGATQVTVLDGHGDGHNFIPELLNPRAEHDANEKKQWLGKLDASYAGVFAVGAHAMAGTLNGFLDHTQSSASWFRYTINGRECGELAQWALVAGQWQAPMLMVSGDEAAVTEARAFFNPIETAAVKRGCGRNQAEALPVPEAQARIREAARRAMALVGKARPYQLSLPFEVTLTYYRSDYCDAAAQRPGAERLDARTIRKVTSNPLELLP